VTDATDRTDQCKCGWRTPANVHVVVTSLDGMHVLDAIRYDCPMCGAPRKIGLRHGGPDPKAD